MNKQLLISIIFLSLGNVIFAQNSQNMLFYSVDSKIEKAIYKTTKKHTLYAYNIANISTPGFEPILYPEDQLELNQMVPLSDEYTKKVLLEHMTASMARNRNIQSAYHALYKKRMDTYRQIATMGKK